MLQDCQCPGPGFSLSNWQTAFLCVWFILAPDDGFSELQTQSLPVILWLPGPDHLLVGREGVGIHGTRDRDIDHEGEVVPTEKK